MSKMATYFSIEYGYQSGACSPPDLEQHAQALRSLLDEMLERPELWSSFLEGVSINDALGYLRPLRDKSFTLGHFYFSASGTGKMREIAERTALAFCAAFSLLAMRRYGILIGYRIT